MKKINNLKELIENNRDSPYLPQYADTLLMEGHIEEAISLLEGILKRNQDDAMGHFVLGKAYYQKSIYDGAMSELERTKYYYPKWFNVYKYFLDISQKKKIKKASKLYQLKLTELDPFYISDESKNVFVPQKVEEFRSSFEAVVKEDVKDKGASSDGESVKDEKRLEEYQSFLEEVVEKDIKDKGASSDGESVKDEKNLEIQQNVLEKKEVKNTFQGAISNTLGEVYLSQGKFKEAKQIFETLLIKKPNNQELLKKVNRIERLLLTD